MRHIGVCRIGPVRLGIRGQQRAIMSTESPSGASSPDQSEEGSATPRPDWADGLRQLYDAVVDEPLPDTLKDLLDRLDESGSTDEGCDADGSDGGHG